MLGVGPVAPPDTAALQRADADPAHADAEPAHPAVPLALGGLALGAFLVSGRGRSHRR